MTKYYWHIYHDSLAAPSGNIEKRIEFIKKHKPPGEVAMRLRLLKEVQGLLPQAWLDAWDEAYRVYQAYSPAGGQDAFRARMGAYQAWLVADQACQPAIEALHRLECPDCPWDGSTIFPGHNTRMAEK